MKPKTIILLVLGIVCGQVAIYVASKRLAMVAIVVAKEDVSQWTIVRDPKELFEVQRILKRTAPANVIPASDFDQLGGRRLKTSLEKGDPLTQANLLDPTHSSMATYIGIGRRASVINFTAADSVVSRCVPGSYVDVMRVLDGSSETVVENALVLAIELKTARGPMIDCTATLQVGPVEAQTLDGARARGTFSLVMRPGADDSATSANKPDLGMVAPPPPPTKEQ